LDSHFIVGDVHGCFHTLKALLTHWDSENEHLVFVGDLIDRGNFSPEVVAHVRALMSNQANRVSMVKGNHEAEMIRHFKEGPNWWYDILGAKMLQQYDRAGIDPKPDARWMAERPLVYETETVLVCHAGISNTPFPFIEDHPESVLWGRLPVKKLNKLQVYGHTPQKELVYNPETDSICVDTGAFKGNCLSAVVVNAAGKIVKSHSVKTLRIDLDT
jgi:serine/threonine protein phosphatase 1